MGIIDVQAIIELLNSVLDKLAVIAFWVWLALAIIRYTRKNITKEGAARGLYLGIVACVEAAILIFFFLFYLPQFLVFLSRSTLDPATVRLVIIYLFAIIWSYYVSHEKSQWRGVTFVIIILMTILFGWLYDRWMGVFAMSVPVLLIYLYIIYRVAQVILPASNPEDKLEARKKTQAFLAYLFGVQHPIWMAKAKTGREFATRIEGDALNEIGKPGIIWTWPHQAAGISKGVGFIRAAGPGLIFTDPYESPLTLVDLRKQSRLSKVNAVTKDGIEIPTIVSTIFAIDKEAPIAPQTTQRRRTNYEGSFEIDHPQGSYPYSSGRIRTVLSTTGVVNASTDGSEKREFFWDDWVLMQAEHVTRLVVAERSLDELWRPKKDDLGVSALDEIADRMKELLNVILKEAGISLISVRIVNYELPDKKSGEKNEENEIIFQNRTTWKSYWEQQIAEANADIEMIYREEIEKAHAYSKSILLSTIADSNNKARSINEALPRHVIAQYFIHALEEYIKGQPGLNVSESKKRIETIKDILMSDRLEGNE